MTSHQPEPEWLLRPNDQRIAYFCDENATKNARKNPTGTLWLGGFKSDMTGTKASALADWARATDHDYTRFDYFAHGQSSGRFIDGTISRWLSDALSILDQVTSGPQVLVGSSMGAWVALLATLARPAQVKGLVLIAPAADFTEKLMWDGFDTDIQATLQRAGVYRQPSEYDDKPYEISYQLIKDGRKHLLLDSDITLDLPVRILQGMADPDVPWLHAMRLVDRLTSTDVSVTLTKKGDHRLSEPNDLRRLTDTLDQLLAALET